MYIRLWQRSGKTEPNGELYNYIKKTNVDRYKGNIWFMVLTSNSTCQMGNRAISSNSLLIYRNISETMENSTCIQI